MASKAQHMKGATTISAFDAMLGYQM